MQAGACDRDGVLLFRACSARAASPEPQLHIRNPKWGGIRYRIGFLLFEVVVDTLEVAFQAPNDVCYVLAGKENITMLHIGACSIAFGYPEVVRLNELQLPLGSCCL